MKIFILSLALAGFAVAFRPFHHGIGLLPPGHLIESEEHTLADLIAFGKSAIAEELRQQMTHADSPLGAELKNALLGLNRRFGKTNILEFDRGLDIVLGLVYLENVKRLRKPKGDVERSVFIDLSMKHHSPAPPKVAPSVVPEAPKVAPSVVPEAPKVAPSVVPEVGHFTVLDGDSKGVPSSVPGAPKVAPSVVPDAPKVAPSIVPEAPKVAPSVVPEAPKVAPSVVPEAPKVAPSVVPDFAAPTVVAVEKPSELVVVDPLDEFLVRVPYLVHSLDLLRRHRNREIRRAYLRVLLTGDVIENHQKLAFLLITRGVRSLEKLNLLPYVPQLD